MRIILTTVIISFAVIAAIGLVIMYSGVYDVAATSSERPLVRWILNTTMERSVRARVDDIAVPSLDDSSLVGLGFDYYKAMCVSCHGSPAGGRGEPGVGLNPPAPDLSEAAKEWKPAELYWIINNGIKMTGMPAFGPTHDEKELWAMVAFLQKLPDMSAAQYRAQAASQEQGGRTIEPHGHEDAHEHEVPHSEE